MHDPMGKQRVYLKFIKFCEFGDATVKGILDHALGTKCSVD